MSTEIYLPQTPSAVITDHRPHLNENISWSRSTEKSADQYPGEIHSYYVSPWCISGIKRIFDLICVVPTLILLSPLFGIIAIAVRVSSSGPIIFRQQRVGRHRKLFTIYKFRTMVANSELAGPGLTAVDDPRIIHIGHFLRRFKLDELPQLFNVLRGDMSLVGPRPKLPELELTSMPCRPGVTGAATLFFRKEQHLLRDIPTNQIETFYSKYIAPTKVKMDADYMSLATFMSDLKVLGSTVTGSGQRIAQERLVAYESCLTQKVKS